jgi:hypothetical protein
MKLSLKLILIIGILGLILGTSVGCLKANAAAGNLKSYGNLQANSNSPAPDFTGLDLVTGQSISRSQFKGSGLILNFMNYGCNPSLNKIVDDQLLAIREITSKRSDLIPISVFCGCCSPDTLRQYAKTNDFNWPWILDTDYSIAAKYSEFLRQYGYPTLIIVGKDQLIKEISGYLDANTLSTELNQLIPVEANK